LIAFNFTQKGGLKGIQLELAWQLKFRRNSGLDLHFRKNMMGNLDEF